MHAHLQTLNPEMTRDVLDAGYTELKKLCLGNANQFTGQMTLERWQTLTQQLEQLELLEIGKVTPDALFTTRFLKE